MNGTDPSEKYYLVIDNTYWPEALTDNEWSLTNRVNEHSYDLVVDIEHDTRYIVTDNYRGVYSFTSILTWTLGTILLISLGILMVEYIRWKQKCDVWEYDDKGKAIKKKPKKKKRTTEDIEREKMEKREKENTLQFPDD